MQRGAFVGSAAAGLIGVAVGALLATAWRDRTVAGAGLAAPQTGASRSATGDRPPTELASATGTPEDDSARTLDPRLATVLQRLTAVVERLDATLHELRGDGYQQAGPAGAPAADGSAGGPWYRRPRALVEWLPPDGFGLVKAWYLEQITEEINQMEARPPPTDRGLQEQIRKLHAVTGDEQVVARSRATAASLTSRLGMEAKSRQWRLEEKRREHATLGAVRTELDLARWLDDTNTRPPKRWQLAEFAEKRARGR